MLFSALEQIHLALVACDSEWVTFYSAFWISTAVVNYSAVWLLHGWCHVKLPPSRRTFCVHHTTTHQFTMSLHSKPHECTFICNLPPALLEEWPGSFTGYCGNTGERNDTEIRVDTDSWHCRRQFSGHLCRDSNPRPFGHESSAVPLSYPRYRQVIIRENNAMLCIVWSSLERPTPYYVLSGHH